MIESALPLGVLPLLAWLAPRLDGAPPVPFDAAREAITLVPERSLAVLDLGGLRPVLEQGLEHPLVRELLATQLAAERLGDARRRAAEGLAFLDGFLGRPALPALSMLASRGALLAIAVDGARPEFSLILSGDDARELRSTLETLFDRVEEHLGAPGALDRPAKRVRGAEVWQLGELFLACRDALLVASNDEGFLRDVLDLAADPAAQGVLGRAEFAAAFEARPEASAVFGWVDLEGLRQLDGGNLARLASLPRVPEGQFLLGEELCALAASRSLAAWVEIEEPGLSLGLAGAGTPPVLPREPDASRPPGLSIRPEDVLSGVVRRDFAALLRERASLFAPEAQPGLAQAISNLSLFFGGKDVAEEILPDVSPWIRVVSRPVAFEGRAPEMPLPALALVAELRDPERTGAEFVGAFQSLIGLMNVDRAQQARAGMRLRLSLENGVEITSAHFAPPRPEDGVDLRYNLEPACAVVPACARERGTLVLGTHVDLVRSLVRELQAESEGAGSPSRDGGGEALELAGAPLARMIERNFEALVQKKSLDEGLALSEAEKEIEGLRLLLASLERARIEIERSGPERVELRASLRLATSKGRTR